MNDNEVWITGSIIKNNMQAIYNGVDVTSLILKQMEGKMSRTAVERELKKIKNIEKTQNCKKGKGFYLGAENKKH